LNRIESKAFSYSTLESIEIPRNVQFIDGSAFQNIFSTFVSIKSSNPHFSMANDFLVDIIHHRLVRNFSSSRFITIDADIEILGSSCFSSCGFLSSISFEPGSRLKRIETDVFKELSSSIIVPSTVLFIASNFAGDPWGMSIAGLESSPEYDRWQELQKSGIEIDFRRICRFNSGLPSLSDCLIDFSGLIERSQLNANDLISTQLYEECFDGQCIILKSTCQSGRVENYCFKETIENFMNLRHPCISGVIGVALPTGLNILKIIEIDFGDNSLSTIVSTSPGWWTPTAKAKAIAGVVLGLSFAHSFGFLHGHLTGNTVFFNDNGVIEITDFFVNGFGDQEGNAGSEIDNGGFSGESWTPEVDIRGFAKLLSEIVVESSAEQSIGSSGIPLFVLEIIANGESPYVKSIKSFSDILKILKLHNFEIIEGVDVEEVCNFVKWIEFSETLIE
jgi:hypothetical protein